MVNIILCDDNGKCRHEIVKLIEKYLKKNKIEGEITEYSDYNQKFMEEIESEKSHKIYILDIEAPTRSGIDIARIIRRKDIESVIIFLTGHEELGQTIIKKHIMCLTFINKYEEWEVRLKKALDKAMEIIKQENVLRIKDRGVTYTIPENKILYITRDSVERKTEIKTETKKYKVSQSMSEIVELLDGNFRQTHKSCIVNQKRVEQIGGKKREIIFDTGEVIDLLSDTYRKAWEE